MDLGGDTTIASLTVAAKLPLPAGFTSTVEGGTGDAGDSGDTSGVRTAATVPIGTKKICRTVPPPRQTALGEVPG